MKRHYRTALTGQTRIDVTPETAGWKYLSFRVVALDQGSSEELGTAGNEVIIVPLSGQGICTFGGRDNPFARSTVFSGPADIFYLPPKTQYTIKASEPAELARFRSADRKTNCLRDSHPERQLVELPSASTRHPG